MVDAAVVILLQTFSPFVVVYRFQLLNVRQDQPVTFATGHACFSEVETNKRQTRVAYGWLVGRRSVCARSLSLRPIGCTSAVCDMNSAAAVRYVACGAMQVLYSPLPFTICYIPSYMLSVDS